MAGALTTTVNPTSLGQGIQDLVKEDLGKGVTDSLNEVDPTFKDIMSTSVGVTNAGIQRGWQFKKVFSTSISGALKWVTVQDADLIYQGYTAGTTADSQSLWQSQVYNASNLGAYPTAAEAPNMGLVVRTLALAKARGNVFLPLEVLQTNELAKATADYVAGVIQGLAKNIAIREAMAFFKPTTGYMAQVASWSADGTSVNATVATLSTTAGIIHHFVNGQVVDVYDDDGSSAPDYADKQNTVTLIVDGVDYVAGTVRLVDAAGGNALCTDAFAASDFIVPKNQTATTLAGPYGLDNWIKGDDTDTLFGGSSGINLVYYKQFKSVVTAIGDALDEDTLNTNVGAFVEAYPGVNLDTILTTRGVTHQYLQLPAMTPRRFVFERTGKALDYKGGWSSVGYEYEGRTFDWKISPYVMPRDLWVVKLGGGNIKKYIPPTLPGSARDGRVGDEIQFIAGMGGHSGIFMLTHASSGAVQPMVEAPFELMYQLAPDDVRGIKLTGLTEA